MIRKPWGSEVVIFESGQARVKLLRVKPGQRLSMQYHREKREAMMLLSGEALIFLGGNKETEVLTMRLANLVGSRGNDWHLLTAGAFITMVMPLIVFFSLQRYFVRGMMAGSVKG